MNGTMEQHNTYVIEPTKKTIQLRVMTATVISTSASNLLTISREICELALDCPETTVDVHITKVEEETSA